MSEDACVVLLLLLQDKYLRLHEFSSGRDVPLASLRRAPHGSSNGLGNVIRSLQVRHRPSSLLPTGRRFALETSSEPRLITFGDHI